MKLRPLLLLLLSASWVGTWTLQGQSPPPLELRMRTEFEFQTAAGQAYLVEGREEGQNWATVSGPIFGDGQPARALLPSIPGRNFKEFRVRPVSASSFAPASTALSGKTIALNDNGSPRQLIFFPIIQGAMRGLLKTDENRARSFVWSVQQTSAHGTTVRLQFSDGTTSTVELKYSNHVLGSYVMRDRGPEGEVQVMEAGAFSVHHGRIRDNSDQAVLPSTLIGQSLGFEESGELSRMDFITNGNVAVTKPDGTVELHTYTYDIKSPGVADLRLDRMGQSDEPPSLYQMSLNTQATGTFNRLPLSLPGGGIVPGALPQPGVFNVPTGPVIPNSATGPPRSLDGKVLQMNGNSPVTLTFNSDGTGTATTQENGSVEVTPFLYNYTPTDEDEASLALTFPGAQNDRVEDYDLDFAGNSSGSFQSSTYQAGELASSSSGNFNSDDS